jgi:hypothetical protein
VAGAAVVDAQREARAAPAAVGLRAAPALVAVLDERPQSQLQVVAATNRPQLHLQLQLSSQRLGLVLLHLLLAAAAAVGAAAGDGLLLPAAPSTA